MRHRLLTAVVFSSVLIVSSVCLAREMTVGSSSSSGFTEIQAAIDAAEEGDTVLVSPGEYVITEPITFRGKAIAVKSESGPEATTIRMSATPVNPERASVVVFENSESEASVLEGFTLTGGTGTSTKEECALHVNAWGDDLSPIRDGGGGVFCFESSPTIRRCTITGNRGTRGGGVYCEGDATFVSCTITGNCCTGPAPGGGGLYFMGHSPTVTNCLIFGNMATELGGGVQSYGSWLTLENCTIAWNKASAGAGVFCDTPTGQWCSADMESQTTIRNCILWGNVNTGECIFSSCTHGYRWPLHSPLHRNNNANPNVSYSLIEGEVAWPGEGNIRRDPHFVSNGAFDFERFRADGSPDFIVQIGDYRLRGDSPSIDTGTSEGAPETDIDGRARPCWSGIDLGAYEYCHNSPPGHPQARFTVAPDRGETSRDVEVNAGDSTSAEGAEIVSYRWDFGDGGAAEGIMASHTYNLPGPYEIRLTIVDDQGRSDSEKRIVSIEMDSCSSKNLGVWTSVDVGESPYVGCARFEVEEGLGCLLVAGRDRHMQNWDTKDEFHFVYRKITGDVVLVGQVSELFPRQHVGVTLRESLEPEAAHATMVSSTTAASTVFGSQGFGSLSSFWFFHRRVHGTRTYQRTVRAQDSRDTWVRIERRGDLVIGSTSSDGVTWREVCRETVDLPSTILAGVAAFRYLRTSDPDSPPVPPRATICNLELLPGARSQHFRRGDCNADGRVDIADGVATLNLLFVEAEERLCRDAADTDDSGAINISDSLSIFNYLFLDGAPPAMPGAALCGTDPTPDELGCGAYETCP